MTARPKLLVHIGDTKTGSTSIQFAFQKEQARLAQQNTAYFGLILENLPEAQKFNWCKRGAAATFFEAQDFERRSKQVVTAVLAGLDRLAEQGIKTAVWSNEAFFLRTKNMIPIFQRLEQAGVDLQFVTYIRRHDKWAMSAYVQFALKGKNYEGPVQSFSQWATKRRVQKATFLNEWQAAFPGRVAVYNFDNIPNVVQHFCKVVGVDEIQGARANSSPSNALLSAWVAFNNRYKRGVRPHLFRETAEKLDIFGESGAGVTYTPPLSELFPEKSDLKALHRVSAEDIQAVNQALIANGEPPFDEVELKVRETDVDSWDMDQMLLRAIFSLQQQVTDLQEELRRRDAKE